MAGSYRVVIVTGGSCGIGREIARDLAGRGYAVVVVYEHDQREADDVVEEILVADGTAVAVRAGLADQLDVERLFAETTATFGGVDLVVHAAGGRDTLVVDQEAARALRPGGAILGVDDALALMNPTPRRST